MDTGFSALESSFNPFVLMTEADRVLAAVQRSDRLNSLARTVVRLLDDTGSEGDEGQVHGLDD